MGRANKTTVPATPTRHPDPGTDNREIRGVQETGENGWRSASVWRNFGYTGRDDSKGAEYISYYEMVGSKWQCEIEYIVVEDEDAEEDNPHRYGVDEHFMVFREVDGDQEDMESSYDGGSYLSYATVEEAEKEARRMAMNDIAWTFADSDNETWKK